MTLRYPNRGERELRYISTSSSLIIGQVIFPEALTAPHCVPALYIRQAKRKSLGGGKGTSHSILSARYCNSENVKKCEWDMKNIHYTGPRILVFMQPHFFFFYRQGIYYCISVLYLFSLKLLGLSVRVSSSSIKPWASEVLRVTQHAGHSDYFKVYNSNNKKG